MYIDFKLNKFDFVVWEKLIKFEISFEEFINLSDIQIDSLN